MRIIRPRALVLAAAIAFLGPAAVAQQSAKPAPTTQSQLQQQIDELKTRLADAELKAKSAALDTDYIQRVQKQYESYYEKVLATETYGLWALGVIITVTLAIAARFSFKIFQGQVDTAIEKTSTQLRRDSADSLAAEVQKLQQSNADDMKALNERLTSQISQTREDLEVGSRYNFFVAQGLASIANPLNAKESFVDALLEYKTSKPRKLIKRASAVTTLKNIFGAISTAEPANFKARAAEELAKPVYDDLESELASLNLDWPVDWGPLAQLLKNC